MVLVPQIKPYSTSCQYPLKNYLTSSIDQQDQLRLEQLKMYEVLLDQTSARARSLLGHQPFLKPLLEVLNELRWDILYKYNFLNILFVTQVNNQLCKKNMYRCWTEIIKWDISYSFALTQIYILMIDFQSSKKKPFRWNFFMSAHFENLKISFFICQKYYTA